MFEKVLLMELEIIEISFCKFEFKVEFEEKKGMRCRYPFVVVVFFFSSESVAD